MGNVNSKGIIREEKEERANAKMKGFIAGYMLRKQIRVKTIKPGIVHIRIRGSTETFAEIGVEIDNDLSRWVDVLSIDPNYYHGNAVGGDCLFNPCRDVKKTHANSNPDEDSIENEDEKSSDEVRKKVLGSSQFNVFINASFFNAKYGHGNDEKGQRWEEHVPIGPTRTASAQKFIKVPDAYKDYYAKLVFDNGTYLSSSPVLAELGQNKFPQTLLEQNKFKYSSVESKSVTLKPGDLYHADHPNPRSGIAIPTKHKLKKFGQNRIRIATATTTPVRDKDKNNGFSMSEWANVMNRLGNMNRSRGNALNLDGGGSVAMGITDQNGELLVLIAQNKGGRDVSTMLVFNYKGTGNHHIPILKGI